MTKSELQNLQKQYPIKKDLASYLNLSMYKLNKLLTLHDLQPEDKRVFSHAINISEEEIRFAMKTMSRKEMAKHFKISQSAFDSKCKKYGIYFNNPNHLNHDEFMKLYNQGLNDCEISKITGIGHRSIQEYRKYKLGLKSNFFKDLFFTDEQFQIFLGGMYGDSHLGSQNDCVNYYFTFRHSLSQEKYCLWKYERLKNLCHAPSYTSQYDIRTDKTYSGVTITSYTNELFTKYDKLFYWYDEASGKRIKYINEELFSLIEPLGLSILFQDDGCGYKGEFTIALCSFSNKDLEIVIKILKDKFDIEASYHKSGVVRIRSCSKDKFVNIIKPYIHDDCMYKIKNYHNS